MRYSGLGGRKQTLWPIFLAQMGSSSEIVDI